MKKIEKTKAIKLIEDFIMNKNSGILILPCVSNKIRYYIVKGKSLTEFLKDEPYFVNLVKKSIITWKDLEDNAKKLDNLSKGILLKFEKDEISNINEIHSYCLCKKEEIEYYIKDTMELYYNSFLKKEGTEAILYTGPFIRENNNDFCFIKEVNILEFEKELEEFRKNGKYFINLEKEEKELNNKYKTYLLK